jgi:hypothetical protein
MMVSLKDAAEDALIRCLTLSPDVEPVPMETVYGPEGNGGSLGHTGAGSSGGHDAGSRDGTGMPGSGSSVFRESPSQNQSPPPSSGPADSQTADSSAVSSISVDSNSSGSKRNRDNDSTSPASINATDQLSDAAAKRNKTRNPKSDKDMSSAVSTTRNSTNNLTAVQKGLPELAFPVPCFYPLASGFSGPFPHTAPPSFSGTANFSNPYFPFNGIQHSKSVGEGYNGPHGYLPLYGNHFNMQTQNGTNVMPYPSGAEKESVAVDEHRPPSTSVGNAAVTPQGEGHQSFDCLVETASAMRE